jgi:hypothetical protein
MLQEADAHAQEDKVLQPDEYDDRPPPPYVAPFHTHAEKHLIAFLDGTAPTPQHSISIVLYILRG